MCTHIFQKEFEKIVRVSRVKIMRCVFQLVINNFGAQIVINDQN